MKSNEKEVTNIPQKFIFKKADVICEETINNLNKFLYTKIHEASQRGEFFTYFDDIMLTEDIESNLVELGYTTYSKDNTNPLLIYGISWAIPKVVSKYIGESN